MSRSASAYARSCVAASETSGPAPAPDPPMLPHLLSVPLLSQSYPRCGRNQGMVKRPANIPTTPGVYIFRRGATPLYVGKAANIQKRLVSYFQKLTELSPKTQKMLHEATSVAFEKTASDVEALIREAELIKKFRP